jgi:glycosyltransferase involved in cell wall biosynthesis
MPRKQPLFSIIVPTYNRPAGLAACLEALSRLDYPRDLFEVMVVDDGSETPLQAVVSDFLDRLDVTLLTQTHAGPAAARNTGAKRAKGKFLAFIDDDCTPVPDWLQKLADRFTEIPDQAIGGRIINSLSGNSYSTTSQIILDVVYAYYDGSRDRPPFFPSGNLALPADQFRAIGGFDITFETSEDRDLCDRWLSHGFGMTYAPEVLVYHNHPLTFDAFWRRYLNYGRGAFRFGKATVGRGSRCFRVDYKFYATLFRYPFSQYGGKRALFFTVLLAITQVANALGFLREGLSQLRRRSIQGPLFLGFPVG